MMFIYGLLIGLILNFTIQTEPIIVTEYVSYPVVVEKETTYIQKELPDCARSSTKTYMDYRAIKDTHSIQYKLIHSDEIHLDERGFLITDDNHIGVAMGSYFGPIGSKYIIQFENGQTLPIIKVEAKSDTHTCPHHIADGNGAPIEFVIDSHSPWMESHRGANGLIFNGNFNKYFEGAIKEIYYEKVD